MSKVPGGSLRSTICGGILGPKKKEDIGKLKDGIIVILELRIDQKV